MAKQRPWYSESRAAIQEEHDTAGPISKSWRGPESSRFPCRQKAHRRPVGPPTGAIRFDSVDVARNCLSWLFILVERHVVLRPFLPSAGEEINLVVTEIKVEELLTEINAVFAIAAIAIDDDLSGGVGASASVLPSLLKRARRGPERTILQWYSAMTSA